MTMHNTELKNLFINNLNEKDYRHIYFNDLTMKQDIVKFYGVVRGEKVCLHMPYEFYLKIKNKIDEMVA